MNIEADIVLRDFQQDDVNCIVDNWHESYFSDLYGRNFGYKAFFRRFHNPIVDAFFRRPTARVMVCANNADPWLILGWIAYESWPEGLILHYIYVKDAFREQGIAAKLLSQTMKSRPMIFTHLTKKMILIMQKHLSMAKDFIFVPSIRDTYALKMLVELPNLIQEEIND